MNWLELDKTFGRRMTQEEARELWNELTMKLDPMSGKAADLRQMGTTVEEAKSRIPKPGQVIGLSTGYPELDEMTGGLDKGEVSVWYGGTSVGKSQITQNIAGNMACKGIPVMMLPLEMGMYLNTSRMMRMFDALTEEKFRQLPIYYPDSKRMDISTLANTVAEGVSKYGIRAVVVDQLQQLVPRTGTNLVEAISATTDELHKIADENQVHVLLISHINRTGDPKLPPKLSELKGSGSIEQDADLCIGLSRNTEDDVPEKGYKAPLDVTLFKNRNRGINRSHCQLRFSPTMRLQTSTLTI